MNYEETIKEMNEKFGFAPTKKECAMILKNLLKEHYELIDKGYTVEEIANSEIGVAIVFFKNLLGL